MHTRQTINRSTDVTTNLGLYPWFQFFRSLIFWHSVWFLFFQGQLSASEAILLAAVYDIGTFVLEVPSGYLSDRVGRRLTLMIAMLASLAGCILLASGSSFEVFLVAQLLLGAGTAFASGTDTALLYDSLLDQNRESEVANHELRAWRASFAALAISAVAGGALATIAAELPYIAAAVSAAIGFILVLWFKEPSRAPDTHHEQSITAQVQTIARYFRNRTLLWLFALTVGMYVFSHVPFVFAQPFIAQSLAALGFSAQAPLASGAVTATMMLVSVAVSLHTARLEAAIGRGRVFLLALTIQVTLITVLMSTVHPAAIALLLLRMVPDALARPFILASIHPELSSNHRATYLSLQSLCGRIAFSGALLVASLGASERGVLTHAALQSILVWYVAAGVTLLIALAATLHAARLKTE